MDNQEELEYVGFWPRVGASIVDIILSSIALAPFAGDLMDGPWFGPAGTGGSGMMWHAGGEWHGLDVLLTAVIVVAFWVAKNATPGKMLVRARIADAVTGGAPSMRQYVIRYLGYYLSMLPLFLGFLWVAFDPKKQGWHDKLAGTVVVRPKRAGTEPVRFEAPR